MDLDAGPFGEWERTEGPRRYVDEVVGCGSRNGEGAVREVDKAS
jgi:hypothetical protein